MSRWLPLVLGLALPLHAIPADAETQPLERRPATPAAPLERLGLTESLLGSLEGELRSLAHSRAIAPAVEVPAGVAPGAATRMTPLHAEEPAESSLERGGLALPWELRVSLVDEVALEPARHLAHQMLQTGLSLARPLTDRVSASVSWRMERPISNFDLYEEPDRHIVGLYLRLRLADPR